MVHKKHTVHHYPKKNEEILEVRDIKLLAAPKSMVPIPREKPQRRPSRINTPMETHHFFFSQFAILAIALLFLGGMYWVLNNDNYETHLTDSYSPVTIKHASSGLELSNPDDELLTFSSSVVVSGTTSAKASVIIAIAGDVDHFDAIEADNTGFFQKTVTLAPGLNRIEISSFGIDSGKTITRTIYYSKEILQ